MLSLELVVTARTCLQIDVSLNPDLWSLLFPAVVLVS